LPLSELVSFKAVLRRGNRVQVPRLFRWQHRMEPGQVLRVCVSVEGSGGEERFLASMTEDGRLTNPKLTVKLLQEGTEESLEGSVLGVTVEPADNQNAKPNPQRGRSETVI
jgi:hypothetical protein